MTVDTQAEQQAQQQPPTQPQQQPEIPTQDPESSATEPASALDIASQFRGLIASGQLGANERLPTVRQTASDFGVAVGTAAKAYKILEHDGLVVSRTAAGTRVSQNAGILSAQVMKRVRALIAEATGDSAELNDVVEVLRLVWRSEQGEITAPDPR